MFDINILTPEDRETFTSILGSSYHEPDLTIAPDGKPYIYRWYVTPRSTEANVYLHVQVASDPERPLHDHPWDNQSVILSGGYIEIVGNKLNPAFQGFMLVRKKGDVVQRKAHWSHRLLLPRHHPYAMTLFTTGPVVRDWGFWTPDGWRSHKEITSLIDGVSTMKDKSNDNS